MVSSNLEVNAFQCMCINLRQAYLSIKLRFKFSVHGQDYRLAFQCETCAILEPIKSGLKYHIGVQTL